VATALVASTTHC